MTPQELKASILQLAIQGKLVPQIESEGNAEDLFKEIQKEKQRLITEKKIKKEKPLEPIKEEEIPFDIPSSWKWVRLNSVISLLSGQDLQPTDYNSNSKGIPYLTGASNIEDGQVIINRWTDKPKAIARRGDLLLTCKGTVGKMSILEHTEVHIARQIMAITNVVVDVKYVQYFIDTQIGFLKSLAKSMIPGIERDNVLSLCFPLPPLEEQKRIVAKIEELLPLVERYGKAYERLEEFNKKFPGDMKKSVLQMAIQGKLVEQRPEEGTAEELYELIQTEKARLIKEGKIKKEKPLEPIKEEEIPFDIPSSWKYVKLREICNLVNGKAFKPEDWSSKGLPIVRIQNLNNANASYNYYDGFIEDDYALIGGELLFAWSGTPGTSFGAHIWTGGRAVLNQHIFRVDFLEDYIDKSFLKYAINERLTKLISIAHGSAGLQHIKRSEAENTIIALPPLEEQKRIVAKLEEVLPLCDALIK